MRLWLALVVMFSACNETQSGTRPEPDFFCEVETFPRVDNPALLDVLLVIDDSASMESVQEQMPEHLALFGNVLENLDYRKLSLHLGVVSGDENAAGVLQTTPHVASCSPPDDSYLKYDDQLYFTCPDPSIGCAVGNYTGELGDTIACIGTLGSSGSSSQPLFESALRALDGSTPGNSDFLRENAFLYIIFITSGDDTSPLAVEEYASALQALKGDPGQIGIGTVRTSQSTRLIAMESRFPNRNSFALISEEWVDSLTLIAESLADVLGYPCLDTTLIDVNDLDPEQPGLQLDCAVSAGEPTPVTVPNCLMLTDLQPASNTPLPCWWVPPLEEGLDCQYGAVIETESRLGRAEMVCAGTCDSL